MADNRVKHCCWLVLLALLCILAVIVKGRVSLLTRYRAHQLLSSQGDVTESYQYLDSPSQARLVLALAHSMHQDRHKNRAAEVLRQMSQTAVPILMTALSDKSMHIRRMAAIGLKYVMRGNKEAVAILAANCEVIKNRVEQETDAKTRKELSDIYGKLQVLNRSSDGDS